MAKHRKDKRKQPRHRIACTVSGKEYRILATEAKARNERLSTLMKDKLFSNHAPKLIFSDSKMYMLLFGKVCLVNSMQNRLYKEIKQRNNIFYNTLVYKASKNGGKSDKAFGEALLTDAHSQELASILDFDKHNISPSLNKISQKLISQNQLTYRRLH